MDGTKFPPQAFKVKVIQEYEVYLYYQQGIYADSEQEIQEMVFNEAIEAAFNEDDLISKDHDDTDTINGFIGFVSTFDPEVKIIYTMDNMPIIIKDALTKRGLL